MFSLKVDEFVKFVAQIFVKLLFVPLIDPQTIDELEQALVKRQQQMEYVHYTVGIRYININFWRS